jgi:hypothetical protein
VDFPPGREWRIVVVVSRPEDEPIPVEEKVAAPFRPSQDPRPHMPDPIPVKLLAIHDVHLPARAGTDALLDQLYVELLDFQRDRKAPGLVYRAENVRLCFEVTEEPVVKRDLRPTGIIVPSLPEAELKLLEAGIEYTRQRGLTPGSEMLVLLDPGGNWIELMEAPQIR